MATGLAYNSYENDDHSRLLDNYHYLAERRCLKQSQYHAPLALRRSVSLEDSSTDPDVNCAQKIKEQFLSTLPSHNPSLSSSLNSLCVRLRRYQLLPEYDEKLARSSDQNDFLWCKTANRLRPIFEKITVSDYKRVDYFPETYTEDEKINFDQCIRKDRRNAVCLGIDRLYYNDQLTLFATIANEVQLEFNLMSSGFKNVK